MKILISDDEDSARYALKKLLVGPGRTILEATDGKQTFEVIVESNPDLVFLDLNMPFKSGLECLYEIKTIDRLKDIAIAIYSTSASDEDIEETFINGANIYIKKPSEFETLKKILGNVVTTNWQYQTSGLNKDNFFLKL